MGKQIVIYPHSEILHWSTDTCKNVDQSHKHDIEEKKPNQKKDTYSMCHFMWCKHWGKSPMLSIRLPLAGQCWGEMPGGFWDASILFFYLGAGYMGVISLQNVFELYTYAVHTFL